VPLFDAKYRLQSDETYVRAFNAEGPPIDAVNALHRYRDAVVTATSNRTGRLSADTHRVDAQPPRSSRDGAGTQSLGRRVRCRSGVEGVRSGMLGLWRSLLTTSRR
jgi:PD-(D/E)XK nuclease superfamily